MPINRNGHAYEGIREWDQLLDFLDGTTGAGHTNFAVPSNPADGDFWIEASGTTPNRIIALKIRDEGATYTLVSIQR